jgi:hypothetical protein
MSQTTIEDRRRGGLIGVAAGDRIGGPVRVALLLAESLLNCGGFNPAEIVVKVNKGVDTCRHLFRLAAFQASCTLCDKRCV